MNKAYLSITMRQPLKPWTNRLLDIQGFAAFLLVTAWMFSAGHVVAGYALGGMLTFVVLLASTMDICIPSMIYRSIFGWPPPRDLQREG